MGDIHQMGGNERTGKSGEQRVLVLVHGVRRDGPGEVLVSELIGHVDDLDGDAAERTGLVGDLLQPVVLLAHVAEHGDNVETELVLQPLDADGGIQTAGIRQNNLFLAHGSVLSNVQDCKWG